MRFLLPTLVAVALVALSIGAPGRLEDLVLHDALAQQENLPPPNANCQPFGNATPLGLESPVPSYEPGLPIWCYTLSPSSPTSVRGANDWVDTYDNNGPALQRID